MARDIREGDLVDHRDSGGKVYSRNRNRVFNGDVALICNIHECHLVARAERLAEVWPTDDAFRRFAAEVADAVQAAMGRGAKISATADSEACRCPLGCLPQAWSTYPTPLMFRAGVVGTMYQRQQFARGFDNIATNCDNDLAPYYRLGQAYRRRFVV